MMPPFSQGRILPRLLQRHAFSSSSSISFSKSATPKNATRTKIPLQSSALRATKRHVRPIDAPSPAPETLQPSPWSLKNLTQHLRHRYILRILLSIPIVFVGILHIPYEIMPVTGPSMSPFLNPKSPDNVPSTDYILLHKVHGSVMDKPTARKEDISNPRSYISYDRGQIVVYRTPHNPERIAVKRVVAVAGDLVEPFPGYPGGDEPVVVPWNHVWVEGDVGTRKESQDSNYFGPISQNLIIGEVQSVWTSGWFWNWNWVDWKQHAWPARNSGRVHEEAIAAAMIDPDDIEYSKGWSDGSIALILERMRQQPEQLQWAFVKDSKTRQETRRLYNNALYVAEIASSEMEKKLAVDVSQEMEQVYGREALVFGIRMRRQPRSRGELPDARNSRLGENLTKDSSASDAENWLRKQGWELERNEDGTIKTLPVASK